MNSNPETNPILLSDPLVDVRKFILQKALYLFSLLSAVLLFIMAPGFWQSNRTNLIFAGATIVIILFLTSLIKSLPLNLRILTLLTSGFLYGLVSIFVPGMNFFSQIALLLFVIMSSIFWGSKAGFFASFISSMIVIVAEILQIVGTTEDFSVLFTAGNIEWAYHSAIFSFAAGLMAWMVSSLYTSFTYQWQREHEKLNYFETQLINSENQLQSQTTGTSKVVSHLATYQTVISQLARGGNKEEICKSILETIGANFHFYFGGIYLLDDKQEVAYFLSGTGDIGEVFSESNHKVKTKDHSLFTQVVATKEYVVVADIRTDPVIISNPLMGATRSQIIFPVLSDDQVIGLLDFQDDSTRELLPDEIQTLKWIAFLLSMYFDRDKLISAYKSNRVELENVYREMTQRNWQTFFKRKKKRYSYRFSHSVLEREVPTPAEVKQILMASDGSNIATQTKTLTGRPVSSIAIPIKLRNETLGALNIQVESGKALQSLMPMLEAAADRLAVALENARLLEEIQEKANREHLISEISAKVRSSTNVEQVLRTTAAEIGRSLGVNEVLVQLRPPK